MVVTASDSLALDQGLDADASAEMPLDDALAMPEGEDAFVDSETGFDESAATDDLDAPVEDDPRLSALQSQLTALTSEKAQWDTARRSLEAKVNHFDQQARSLQMREQARAHWLNAYFDENGLDKRDLHVLENTLTQAEKQSVAQRQQATTGFTESLQTLFTNHQARMQQVAFENGQQLFDPKDPEIETAFLSAAGLVKRHHEEEGARPGSPLHLQSMAAFDRLKALQQSKREAGIRQMLTQSRAADAKRQATNRAKQDTRGKQNTARGGSAAPLSFADYMKQMQTEMPNATYAERWEAAVRRSGAQQ